MIYLDNNATTKIDKAVYLRQCEILNKYYGNPSSLYPIGVEVKKLLTEARHQIASLINADLSNGDQILFTSCATESNNAVLHSVMNGEAKEKKIIISSTEHPSILNTAAYYEKLGCNVIRIGVDNKGLIKEEELMDAIDDHTVLVSVGLVNSETGVVQDVAHLTEMIKSVGKEVLVHTDAVQGAGKIPIDVGKLGVDFLTLSGHKFYAPKGVGALFIKRGTDFTSFMYGGHQEFGLRAGTENTASIIAMGLAAKRVQDRLQNGEMAKVETLRNALESYLEAKYDVFIAGKDARRVGNTCNVGFYDREGSQIVLQLALKGICVSSGTACNSENTDPSNVLKMMRVPEKYIRTIRISLSYDTSESDIKELVAALDELL